MLCYFCTNRRILGHQATNSLNSQTLSRIYSDENVVLFVILESADPGLETVQHQGSMLSSSNDLNHTDRQDFIITH